MAKFLVEYKHVEETTYQQWIEAESKEDAISKIDKEADFEKVVDVQGIEMKDFKIIRKV